MKQRINLLPPRPIVERDFLSFGYVISGVMSVLVLCSLISGGLWYDINDTNLRLNQLDDERQQQKQQLDKLGVMQRQRTPDVELMAYRDRVKQTVLSKQRLAGLLETVQPDRRQGFSEGLLAFSNSTPDKVWITGFKMTTGSLVLDVAGESADVSQIPLLLRQLTQQSVFQQISFAELVTERTEAQTYLFNAHGLIFGDDHD
ncbi:PilN domain-containing protein [Neptunomonas antarctica]|uniref:Tfp pilus assembly protein PilN n=1 Tax=Neptunomonas antarctica TaxID=619304 RepID=A0A1N7MN53_9GAMM|nr:PilN domain-containing protein [Neptunomonas antarctica]SIS87584.1 Tfp pilus assembly protein PilN [Neptunomonas antarctica]